MYGSKKMQKRKDKQNKKVIIPNQPHRTLNPATTSRQEEDKTYSQAILGKTHNKTISHNLTIEVSLKQIPDK